MHLSVNRDGIAYSLSRKILPFPNLDLLTRKSSELSGFLLLVLLTTTPMILSSMCADVVYYASLKQSVEIEL